MMSMPMITLPVRTTGDRVSRAIAVIALTLLSAVVVAFIVTIIYPWNPITSVEIRVVGSPHVGAYLTVEVTYCKARSWTPSDVRWSLINEVSIVLPDTPMSFPPGCHVKRIAVAVPRHVMPGDYKLKEELHYEPWPWKSYVYERESPVFRLSGSNEEPAR